MTDLTRKQIEEVRRGFPHSEALSAICDMALRTLDAEARNRGSSKGSTKPGSRNLRKG